MTRSTRALLLCGAIAGPIFSVAWIVEGAGRTDYDPYRHPISSLAIGEDGWMQAAAFIVTGCLVTAFAFGLRRTLPPGSSRWVPRLVGGAGNGLIGAALFVTDPLNGYPPGTPLLPLHYSLPGRLHRLFSAMVFLGLPIASFLLARHFARWGNRAWAAYSAASGIAFLAAFVLAAAGFVQADGLADFAGLFQRVSLTIGWAWLSLLAVHLLRRIEEGGLLS